MPLVVPGLQSKGGDDKTSKWMNDLMGKKIGESSDQTVSFLLPSSLFSCSSLLCFEGKRNIIARLQRPPNQYWFSVSLGFGSCWLYWMSTDGFPGARRLPKRISRSNTVSSRRAIWWLWTTTPTGMYMCVLVIYLPTFCSTFLCSTLVFPSAFPSSSPTHLLHLHSSICYPTLLLTLSPQTERPRRRRRHRP